MANYSIINSDNVVYVDGVGMPVDCSHLPSFFHALQWYGSSEPAYGEIEYAPDQQGRKMPNTRFSDFAPYQYLVDGWNAAKADADAKAAALAATVAAQEAENAEAASR